MKILIWNECYRSGGQDQNIIDIIKNWPEPADEFIVAVNRTHEGLGKIKDFTKDKAEISLFPFATFTEIVESSFWKKLRSFNRYLYSSLFFFYCLFAYFPKSLIKTFFFLSKRKISAIIINSGGFPGLRVSFIFPAISSFLLNVNRRIIVIHNFVPAEFPKWDLHISSFLIRLCLQDVIAVSQTLKSSFSGYCFYDKIKVILNGVNIDETEVNEWEVFAKPVLIGIFGEFHPRKGHKILLDAIKKIESEISLKLLIVGRGDKQEYEAIVKHIETLNLRSEVIFKDFVPDCKLLMAQCDIVVQPSIAYESFGRVAAEAQGLGRPVIASNQGGLKEVVFDGINGLCFDYNSSEELADKILSMVANPVKTKQMVQEGRKFYTAKFSAKRMARQYFEFCYNYGR